MLRTGVRVRQISRFRTAGRESLVIGKQSLCCCAFAFGHEDIAILIARPNGLQYDCVKEFGVIDDGILRQAKRQIVRLKRSRTLAGQIWVATDGEMLNWTALLSESFQAEATHHSRSCYQSHGKGARRFKSNGLL